MLSADVWEEGQKSKRKRRHGHTFALADADDWDILQAAAPESKRRKISHPQRKAGVRKHRARAKSSAAVADGVSAADADADTVAADAAVQPLRLKCVAWRMTAIRRQTIALTLSPVARMLYKRCWIFLMKRIDWNSKPKLHPLYMQPPQSRVMQPRQRSPVASKCQPRPRARTAAAATAAVAVLLQTAAAAATAPPVTFLQTQEGQREIDWIACNRSDAVSSVSFGSERISDHKALRFQLEAAYTPVRVGVLPRTGDLRRPPEVPTDQWRAALASAWAASPHVDVLHSSLRQGCADVQKLWDEFQRALRQTFALAFQTVQVQPPLAAKLQAKGGRAKVSWENQSCKGPRLNPGDFAARKKRRHLARLHDYLRIASRAEDGSASEQEVLNLQALRRVLGAPTLRRTRELIRTAKAELDAHEDRTKNQALKSWRQRLYSSTAEVSRWLKSKESPLVHCLCFTDEGGQVCRTASVVEGAQAIYDYWKTFWQRLDRNRPALQARTAALLATVPSPENAIVFPLPQADALQSRARKSTGSGSPDGRIGSELKRLPLPVFETFAQLAAVWVSTGSVPAQFTEARMICIPKKVADRVCDTANTRPITVMSTWWRLWVSTLYHSDAFQAWMRSVLMPEIAAINGEDLYVTLLRIFEQLAEQGMVLALDFTKAFDALDARNASEDEVAS